jgi:hypothetical protein
MGFVGLIKYVRLLSFSPGDVSYDTAKVYSIGL